jgi:hypothetical protein
MASDTDLERFDRSIRRDAVHAMLTPSEIEAPPCHLARLISRQASFANVRPHGVDRTRGRDADLSHKGCTAIAAAPHMSLPVIDISAGDSIEIGVIFQ